MNLLWPDLSPKAASNNLRQTVHAARRALDPDPAAARHLALRDEQLSLCPEGRLWVDAEAFEEAAAGARRSRDPAAYRAAIDLYAGELLPEDRYEEWTEGPRARLRETYLALLLELARHHEKRGDPGSAIEELRKVITEEPAHEEAHAALMRLYALSGRKGEALRQYERLRETLTRELGAEPDVAVRALREEIAAGRFPSPDAPVDRAEGPPRHNLPAPRTSFVGRERELVEVKRDLAITRLLTLTGAGGTGKTRLALEAARDLSGAYPDGAWLVEFAPLSEPHLVPQEVAGALGVREQPDRPLTGTLAGALFEKELLLVLDNCEHLLDACARLADVLLDACPGVRILATSREPLGVGGETVRPVPPLPIPDADLSPDVEDLTSSGAVRLFVERARLRLPAFEITPENARAVAEACRRLGGLPLAIELAAGRMGTLAAYQLAERLENSLSLLEGGPRTAAPRQRTMRASLEWSYEPLDETERELFGRLSVFAGGWGPEAAEAVSAGGGVGERDVLMVLSRLVDKSLVIADASGGGGVRYRMLEPVRRYAREKLEESGEAEATLRQHATFFLALAEEAEPGLRGSEQRQWLARLETEHDNLRAAISWSLERGEAELGLRLSGALGEFWHMRGHLDEGRRWLEAALARGESAPVRIKALLYTAFIAWEQLDYERSEALGEEALAMARRLVDEVGTASALFILGLTAMYQLNFDRAAALLEEAAALQRGMGDRTGLTRTIQAWGLVAIARHDFERAAELHEESLALAKERGDQLSIILALGLGALAFLGRGDYRRAGELFAEGLELSRRLEMRHAIIFHLHIAAATASSQGEPVRSARLWGAAESLMQAMGISLAPVERYHYGPYIDAARALLDEAAWDAAWAEGKAMTPEQAIEYALSEEEYVSPRAPEPEKPSTGRPGSELTRREEEITTLVARGLTNRQIAEELVVSERTVDAHVRKILRKLGLRSRTRLAAWATEQQLPPSDPD